MSPVQPVARRWDWLGHSALPHAGRIHCTAGANSPACSATVSGEGHESAAPTMATRSTSTTGSARPAGRGTFPRRRSCPALRLRVGPGSAPHTPRAQSRAPPGRLRRSAHQAPDRHQPHAATARQPLCPATVHGVETPAKPVAGSAIRAWRAGIQADGRCRREGAMKGGDHRRRTSHRNSIRGQGHSRM